MSPLLRARPPFIAIALLSACMLAYEVALTRLFSIVLWHHFAYMIISAAMLGYGASGTALALLKEKIVRASARIHQRCCRNGSFDAPVLSARSADSLQST